MAYVPGFQYDVFISYAHGDDREWIDGLVQRLQLTLDRRIGSKTAIWIDKDAIRNSRDFTREIPDSVRSSAVFVLLPSPTYIRSKYCVDDECETFKSTLGDRRARFAAEGFANELFAIRCPILPVDGNEHWTLFPGLTDIAFCSDSTTFRIGSAEFEDSFGKLVGELVQLLKRMRNHSTSVFLYPWHPSPDLDNVRQELVDELSAHSYRVLPDRNVNVPEQLREAFMSVFLLGREYNEMADSLVTIAAAQPDKPWVAWCAPTVESGDANQIGFCAHIEQLDAPSKTYLNAATLPAKLKEEILAVLKPNPREAPVGEGKPRVYLVYNARDAAERRNAGLISYNFRGDFHFDHPDDPARHTERLSRSDGVLLVWGSADEEWCSREFREIVQTARSRDTRGLCLFDPMGTKRAAAEEIRRGCGDVYIAEEFGPFDPRRLDSFFTPLRRRSARVSS